MQAIGMAFFVISVLLVLASFDNERRSEVGKIVPANDATALIQDQGQAIKKDSPDQRSTAASSDPEYNQGSAIASDNQDKTAFDLEDLISEYRKKNRSNLVIDDADSLTALAEGKTSVQVDKISSEFNGYILIYTGKVTDVQSRGDNTVVEMMQGDDYARAALSATFDSEDQTLESLRIGSRLTVEGRITDFTQFWVYVDKAKVVEIF